MYNESQDEVRNKEEKEEEEEAEEEEDKENKKNSALYRYCYRYRIPAHR